MSLVNLICQELLGPVTDPPSLSPLPKTPLRGLLLCFQQQLAQVVCSSGRQSAARLDFLSSRVDKGGKPVGVGSFLFLQFWPPQG